MSRPLEGKLVLVADDDDDNAELAVGILAFEGAEVRKAVSGHQAADILASWRPDVLVIDLAMPEMDGCGLLRLARSDLGLGDVPAIAATAHAFDHFKRAAEQAGFNEFIVKPYEPTRLVELVVRVTSQAAPSLRRPTTPNVGAREGQCKELSPTCETAVTSVEPSSDFRR